MIERLIVVIAILLALADCSANVQAQGPTPPKGVSGYTVSVENNWVSAQQGYYPIRVTIATNPPLAAVVDEQFTVSFKERHYSSSEYLVKAPIVIPAGSNSGTVEFYTSAIRAADAYQGQILVERGRYDGNFDRRDLLMTEATRQATLGLQPTLLMISSKFSKPGNRTWLSYQGTIQATGTTLPNFSSAKMLPSFDELETLFGDDNSTRLATIASPTIATTPSAVMDRNVHISGVHPNHLPEHWIGLTGVEQILITLADFKSICGKQETSRANLEKWVAAGGVLVVIETSPQQADNLLPLLLGPDRSVLADRIAPTWKTPNEKIRKLRKLIPAAASGPNGSYYYGDDSVWYNGDEITKIFENAAALSETSTIPDSAEFAITDYLNGRIVAVGNDMSKWNAADWTLLHNTICVGGLSIRQRIGSSTGGVIYEYLKIPGVGDPPIRMFQILISLFILLAGPVMLLILKKTEQMQYLFVAVPCLSIAVCGSLLSYAILVDGGKNWGRTQTVTTLDHRTNMAVTHARATYYNGSRPKPYQFDKDTVALTGLTDSAERLETQYERDGFTLSGGEMRPRRPHGVVTVRSHLASQRLKLIESKDNPNGTPSIQNLLEADVKLALFKTTAGLFLVKNLKANETAVGKLIDENTGRDELRNSVRIASPLIVNSFRGRATSLDYGDNWGDDVRGVDALRNPGMAQILDHTNTYVAILEHFPLAAEQIEDVEYKLQLHVVHGQW